LSTNLPLPAPSAGTPAPALPGEALTRWAVTTITALIALLAFAFSFGNVTSLALYLKVPIYIAWLVGPAVDLSVIGLLIGIRYLSLAGYTDKQLEKPRRLLIGCGLLTMALNTAESICTHHVGTAAFDAVAPSLLLGWSENGPWLLRQIYAVRAQRSATTTGHDPADVTPSTTDAVPAVSPDPVESATPPTADSVPTDREPQRIDGDDPLLPRARELDIAHRRANGRPISRDALRAELRIARDRAGDLCQQLRAEAAAAVADVQAAGAAPEREAVLAAA
jgi:hypothetical protein